MKLLLFMLACNQNESNFFSQMDFNFLTNSIHRNLIWVPQIIHFSTWVLRPILNYSWVSFSHNSHSFIVNAKAPIYNLWDSIIFSLYYVDNYSYWEYGKMMLVVVHKFLINVFSSFQTFAWKLRGPSHQYIIVMVPFFFNQYCQKSFLIKIYDI